MEHFELCEISPKILCSFCLKVLDRRHRLLFLCDMFDPHRIHKTLTKEKFDTTIPYFVMKKGTRHGARCGKTDAQREYRQAKDCLKKAVQNKYSSILQRFQQSDTSRESQQAIGWDEDTCRRLDKIASEDHSYTWDNLTLCLSMK